MGWIATFEALINGSGVYGDVNDSLHGESSPKDTLIVALNEIEERRKQGLNLSRNAKIRIAYWRRSVNLDPIRVW